MDPSDQFSIRQISREQLESISKQWAAERNGEAKSGQQVLLFAFAAAASLSPELRKSVDDIVQSLCSPTMMVNSYFQCALGDLLFALLGDPALIRPSGIWACSPELLRANPELAEYVSISGKAHELGKKLGRDYPCFLD